MKNLFIKVKSFLKIGNKSGVQISPAPLVAKKSSHFRKTNIERPTFSPTPIDPVSQSHEPHYNEQETMIQKRPHVRRLIPVLAPLTLLLIVGFLTFINYTPGAFLTGWDTLHPEFNLPLAFKRVLSGVWRGDQGLGAIAAHSHMSELPRLLYLSLVKLFLPLHTLRYSFFALCLLLGPLGMYFFSRYILSKKLARGVQAAAFIGALGYLLNLATLQHFYVPFEMFATQYAALPWLFLSSAYFLQKGNKFSAVSFALISFLASPMAYAATLFYTFAAALTIFLIANICIEPKKWKSTLKRSFVVLVLLASTNLYWILPNLYSIRYQSTEISESKINSLFTPEAFLHNKSYGDLANVTIQKSFLFNWNEYNFEANQFVPLLNEWTEHLQKPGIIYIAYLFVSLALIGCLLGVIRRDRVTLTLLPVLLFVLFFLLNENGPTAGIYRYLREHSDLLAEGFRMPFTKFSILFTFIGSYFLSYFFSTLYNVKKGTSSILQIATVITATVLLVTLMLPAFRGNLMSPSMRQSIPAEYFSLFDWMKGKEGSRIAKFPVHTLWGWEYNSWGYQGAGFLWFGMDNPMLVRDFDRWNADNETFYNQMHNAVYTGNFDEFEHTLEKYGVKYLLVDKSIINAGNSNEGLFNDELEQMILQSSRIVKAVEFGNIVVYETDYSSDEVTVPVSVTPVQTDTTYTDQDKLYSKFGTYVSDSNSSSFPFIQLSRSNVEISHTNSQTIIKSTLSGSGEFRLDIPNIYDIENQVPVVVSAASVPNGINITLSLAQPQISVNGKAISSDPLYLTQLFRTNGRSVGYVSVGDTVFKIDATKPEAELGTAMVSLTDETPILVYTSVLTEVSYPEDISKATGSLCKDDTQKVKTIPLNRGINMEVSSDAACIGSGVELSKPSILAISYETKNLSSPYFCVNKAGIEGCLNTDVPTVTNEFGLRRINHTSALSSGEYWLVFVAEAQASVKTVEYNKIEAGTYESLGAVRISLKESFSQFATDQSILVTDPQTIEVSMPTVLRFTEKFAFNRGQSDAFNCELQKTGTVSKQFTGSSVVYEAQDNGIVCDYYDFRSRVHDTTYLLWLTGNNSEGRPLKTYVTSGPLTQEELLPQNQYSSWFVLPEHPGHNGTVVNVEARSFGSVKARNEITSISLEPISARWLSEISLIKTDAAALENSTTISELPSFLGITRVSVTVEGEGIIAFNQGYERGWVAYSGRQKLEHLELNGWQNGWRILDGNHVVWILYAPNILEWVGLFGGISLFIFVLAREKKHLH